MALLGGLPVAGAQRGGDPGPGRAAVPGRLDEGQLAVLELGRDAAGGGQRGERGRVVQAAGACCGGQPGQRLRDAGEPVTALHWHPSRPRVHELGIGGRAFPTAPGETFRTARSAGQLGNLPHPQTRVANIPNPTHDHQPWAVARAEPLPLFFTRSGVEGRPPPRQRTAPMSFREETVLGTCDLTLLPRIRVFAGHRPVGALPRRSGPGHVAGPASGIPARCATP